MIRPVSIRLSNFCFLLIALLFGPAPSNATTAVMLSDEEMVIHSRLIVVGKVRSVVSARDDLHSPIFTYVKIRVDAVLKGPLSGRTIVLKQLGGVVGGVGMHVFGQPEFERGQRVLLYLDTGPDGTLQLAHSFMGAFSIFADAEGKELVSRSVTADEVYIQRRHDANPVSDRADLAVYLDDIEQALRRNAPLIEDVEASRAFDSLVTIPPEYSRIRKSRPDVSANFTLLGNGVRWTQPDSGASVSFHLNSNQAPVAGGAEAEIRRAMTAWRNQSGSSISVQLAGQTSRCGLATDSVNSISFGDCLNQLSPPVGCAGVIAQTRVVWTNETSVANGRTFNRLIEADVVFNKGLECFLGISSNLAEVACHELGHAIGLNHSTDQSAIMRSFAHGGGRDAALSADDIAGVLAVYPGIGGGIAPLDITSPRLSSGVVNHAYRQVLSAAGGVPPYRWGLIGGTLPPGLALSQAGVLEGIPASTGTFFPLIQVTDSSGRLNDTDSNQFSVTINSSDGSPLPVPVISRVKVKGRKKLVIFGENFRVDSVIVLNGQSLPPRSFERIGSSEKLSYKGRLSLLHEGANALYVRNGDSWSQLYMF